MNRRTSEKGNKEWKREREGREKREEEKKREGDPKRLEAKWLQLMYKIKKSFSSASKRGKRESGKEGLRCSSRGATAALTYRFNSLATELDTDGFPRFFTRVIF